MVSGLWSSSILTRTGRGRWEESLSTQHLLVTRSKRLVEARFWPKSGSPLNTNNLTSGSSECSQERSAQETCPAPPRAISRPGTWSLSKVLKSKGTSWRTGEGQLRRGCRAPCFPRTRAYRHTRKHTHAHTHRNTHTLMHTHRNTHRNTHACAHTHIDTSTHTRTTCTHTPHTRTPHTQTHIDTHTQTHIYIDTSTHAHTHTPCTHAHTHTCTHMHTHMQTHTYRHKHTCTHTVHACTRA